MIRRRTRIHFAQVTDDLIPDAFEIYEGDCFKTAIKKHPRVKGFIKDFWRWNEYALSLMNQNSFPYISMQQLLAKMIAPFTGEVLADIGCGAGDFCARLLQQDGHWIRKIFAVDIDAWGSLARVPQTLKDAGYRGKVALAQDSTMSRLPIWDETVDCVVSSLGGVTYAGWWFEDGELVCEGREALRRSLKDIRRILKPGGYLGFSGLMPNPDFMMIFKYSLWEPLRHCRLKPLWMTLKHGLRIKKISAFMHECECKQTAHYLTLEEWAAYLKEAGFEVVDASVGESYAKQGIVVVARKVS
ncbi:MAG: class I SAM-dependent methyltransferase [Patescibacteria group bacterium]